MTAFLQQAAAHYFNIGNLSHTCFLFPNRRSLVFFRRHLAEEVKASGKPMVAPELYTVNDFFFKLSGKEVTGRIELLLRLYDCYKKINPKAESLDDFIFWGDVLLSDFDDVDKYLVDAKALFTNISDLKEIQDDFSYLTPRQKNAILEFIGHFRNGGKLTIDLSECGPSEKNGSHVKGKFLKIWNILFRLYSDFKKSLEDDGLAYEGMAYREIAEKFDSVAVPDVFSEIFPDKDLFVFVGLNALNKCERKTLSKMQQAGMAQFCWDYQSPLIKDKDNKSSFFMEDNITRFPNALAMYQEDLPDTKFTTVSIASSVGQAKQLPFIFKELGEDIGTNTAVVLPDENLLIPVMNSIPENILDINVTMGYPMGGSELHSLLQDVGDLQLHMRLREGKWYFYHKHVSAIFSSGILKAILEDEEKILIADIKKNRRYFIPSEAFDSSSLLSVIFTPIITDPNMDDNASSTALADYFQRIITAIAPKLKDIPSMVLEQEFAREYYLAIGQLRQNKLDIKPATWLSLQRKLAAGINIPFKGEPLKGLQIMGPLETRSLDFDNIIILSCNEGVFPRHSVSSSFIPAELRRGFDLPTYEYQDAVWAYYFYRLIQRAKNVWMVFDSRPDTGKSGEESRYIKQLEMHYGKQVRKYCAFSPISTQGEEKEIIKTTEHVDKIRHMILSASTLQKYLFCPAKFFYYKIEGLRDTDEVNEALDAGMIGNIFHKTMEILYKDRRSISEEYLKGIRGETVKSIIDSQICDTLGVFEITGRNIIYSDMVSRYVRKVIERDIELMHKHGVNEIQLLGIELPSKVNIDGFKFSGVIDRLDSILPGEIRIIDYKTGAVSDEDFKIDENNAESIVEALFAKDSKKRPKIALQLYIYDLMVKNCEQYHGERIVNSIYQTNRLFKGSVESVALSERFCMLMEEKVSSLLKEMTDTNIPFHRTDNADTCAICDFKNICGR